MIRNIGAASLFDNFKIESSNEDEIETERKLLERIEREIKKDPKYIKVKKEEGEKK